jgi:ferrous iron transport protein A
MNSLNLLKTGESGVIQNLRNTDVSVALLEMGILPDTKVTVNFKAPLGSPMCINIGYDLVIGSDEAENIILK